MARVLLTCPKCHKKLETAGENVGREGQCPGCENIFPIAAPDRAASAAAPLRVHGTGWLAQADEYEYQETTALSGVGAVFVGVLLLAGASTMRWTPSWALAADFVAWEKALFLVISVACAAFMAVSFLARKSLVPAAVLGAAWGTMAVVWSFGILQILNGIVGDFRKKGLPQPMIDTVRVEWGIYLTVGAGFLTLAAGLYLFTQNRDSSTFRRIGTFLVTTQVIAAAVAVLLLVTHAGPGIRSRLPKEAAAALAAQRSSPSAHVSALPESGIASGVPRAGAGRRA
jgi:hypothetical protein